MEPANSAKGGMGVGEMGSVSHRRVRSGLNKTRRLSGVEDGLMDRMTRRVFEVENSRRFRFLLNFRCPHPYYL